jgi:hypothetical protein
MDTSSSISTEAIQRRALTILNSELNSKIDSLSAAWTAADDQFYADLGRTSPGFTVEHIDANNMYAGTVPSLINAPVERYPNLCTIAYIADPKRSNDDWGDNYTIALNVEVMVKSDNFGDDLSHLGEEQVNSRIQKTLEAVHEVIMDHRSLNNLVEGISAAPRQTIGEVFIRRVENSRGDRWMWQGGVLAYSVDKYVSF